MMVVENLHLINSKIIQIPWNKEDKQIPKGYPQEQGKVEAYNKIVIAEFLQVEELIDMKDGIEKYESFVNSYNYEREHMVE